MSNVLTADEFDACFDSGEDMSDLLEWDKAFHDDADSKLADVAAGVHIPCDLLDAAQRIAERNGQTRSEFLDKAIGVAVTASQGK